jgi:multiple sugar transport system permease protein
MENRNIGKWIIHILLVLMSIVCIFPFFWLLRSSFMTSGEIFAMPMPWLPEPFLVDNYTKALTQVPFATYFVNTLIVVLINMVGNIFSSSFTAFGFSRIEFKGRNFFFMLVLSTMMIPSSVILIPQFFGWKTVGAYDTFWPLIIPAFFVNAFFIFLLKQFYASIPKDYDEAAFMDGANYLTIYSKVILPLSRPALATVGVFTFMWNWNDFFGPLIYLKEREHYTLALGLQSFMGQYVSQWNYLMAASTVVIIPMIVLFFFAQRAFIEGITFSGIKG